MPPSNDDDASTAVMDDVSSTQTLSANCTQALVMMCEGRKRGVSGELAIEVQGNERRARAKC